GSAGGYLSQIAQYYQQGKGTGKGGSKDPTGDAVLAPTREARARTMALMPEAANIGGSIHPHTGAMTGAVAAEREGLQNRQAETGLAHGANALRKTWALGNTVEQGLGLVKDLVTDYYTGGMGGGGGMSGSLGGMAGGALRSYMNSGGGGGGMD